MRRIHVACKMHLRSMIEDGEDIPMPVEVSRQDVSTRMTSVWARNARGTPIL